MKGGRKKDKMKRKEIGKKIGRKKRERNKREKGGDKTILSVKPTSSNNYQIYTSVK